MTKTSKFNQKKNKAFLLSISISEKIFNSNTQNLTQEVVLLFFQLQESIFLCIGPYFTFAKEKKGPNHFWTKF